MVEGNESYIYVTLIINNPHIINNVRSVLKIFNNVHFLVVLLIMCMLFNTLDDIF